MLSTRDAINRALDLAGNYRFRRGFGRDSSQDLVDLMAALADAKASADAAGDVAAAFVVQCIVAGVRDILPSPANREDCREPA